MTTISSTALYEVLLDDIRSIFGSGPENFPFEELGPKGASAKALLQSAIKKLAEDEEPEAEQRAIDEFLRCNEACRTWTPKPSTLQDEYLLGQFRHDVDRRLSRYFNRRELSMGLIFDLGRTGPGSSIGAKGRFDFYSKMFDSKMSVTDVTLHQMYKRWCTRYAQWDEAERFRDSSHGISVVAGNRTSTVPKRTDIRRTICTEPSLNMFAQLGLGRYFEDFLKADFGIDLSNQQEVNRNLAHLGSQSGLLATIDLSSASDTISLDMVRWALPAPFMGYIEALRSPVTDLPSGRSVPLYMVSTMGNGFTFPLQTLLFSSVVSAVYTLKGYKQVNSVNFGANGDDLIVKSDCFAMVNRLITLLGFKVNESKSYSVGSFRESCGGDYFDGNPTRGVYIKRLGTLQDRLVAYNRLNLWSTERGIPLPRTLEFLRGGYNRLVPMWEADDAGIKVSHAQAIEAGYFQNGTFRYRGWRPTKKVIDFDGEKLVVSWRDRGAVVKRVMNPSGAILSFIRGDLRQSKVTRRLTTTRTTYKLANSVTPNWENQSWLSQWTP